MLYDRERELALLDGALARATQGQGGLVLVEGPPGVGKTTLLREAARQADAAGAQVLTARAGELERDHFYGLVRQLFEPALARANDAERDVLLGGAARAAAAPLGMADGEPVFDVTAALGGLFWLTANLAAERPLVLVVDDLQWSDVPSMRFLLYLVRRLDDVSVLVVGGARPATDEAALLQELACDPTATVVAPRLLGQASVASLVRERYDAYADPAFVEECERASGGNPFLLGELLQACTQEQVPASAEGAQRIHDLGPRTIARAVLLRIAALGADARALVRAVAIGGTDVALPRAAQLAGLTPDAASAAADALAAVAVLESGRPLEFLHPVIRSAVYGDLPAGDRSSGHRQAARLLAAEDAAPDEVAAHLAAAEPTGDPWVVDVLVGAAGAAIARGAADGALPLLRRALAEPPASEQRDAVLIELGRAASIAGDHVQAVEALLPVLGRMTDPGQRGETALLLIPSMTYAGRGVEGDALNDQLVAELEPVDRELALKIDAHERYSRTDAEKADRLRRYRSLAGATPGERLVLSTTCHILALLGEADVDETIDIAHRALPSAAAINIGSPLEGTCTFETLWGLLLCDRPDPTHALGDAMARGIRDHGYEFPFVFQQAWAAELAYREGRLPEAQDSAERALELMGRYPIGTVPGHRALGFLVLCHLERGAVPEARHAWDTTATGPNALSLWGETMHFEAELLVAEGYVDEGVAKLEAFGALLTVEGRHNPSYWPWRARLAPLLARLDRVDEARAVLDEGLARARAFGSPAPIAMLLRAQAAVEGDEAGIELLEQASALAAASPARLEHARILVDLGAAQRRRQRRTEGRETLKAGLDLALACDATALADRAREELAASGARLRRERRTGVDALTPSERRIAQLAAQSVTNREIAQQLFLSVRTVEMHLGNAYRKLGIASRTELAAALGDDAVLPVDAADAVLPAGVAPSGTVSILFSDIEGSTAILDRMGDARWLELLRVHNRLVREEIEGAGGYEVKTIGDAFMVAFPSVRRALTCAVGIQRRLAVHNAVKDAEALRVRIGLHVGEALPDEADYHGRAVVVAARVAAEARGGEVLATSLIRELAGQLDGVSFGPGRDVALKGLRELQTVHPVVW
jgi:class 3 adenylate cyclase